jgi:hypothetical protein
MGTGESLARLAVFGVEEDRRVAAFFLDQGA